MQQSGTVLVEAGSYREHLVLQRPISIMAEPKASDGSHCFTTLFDVDVIAHSNLLLFGQGADVEIVWETDEPYIHTVEISSNDAGGGQVVLQGIRINHYSKSVANNYAVYINVSVQSTCYYDLRIALPCSQSSGASSDLSSWLSFSYHEGGESKARGL